jgi:hypothetical protein
VTTGTTAATYSGTLTATPNTGTAANQAVSLVVNPAPTLLFTYLSLTTQDSTLDVWLTYTFKNNNATASTITAIDFTSTLHNVASDGSTCVVGASLAAGATCTVRTTALKDCQLDYQVTAALSNVAGMRVGPSFTVPAGIGVNCF